MKKILALALASLLALPAAAQTNGVQIPSSGTRVEFTQSLTAKAPNDLCEIRLESTRRAKTREQAAKAARLGIEKAREALARHEVSELASEGFWVTPVYGEAKAGAAERVLAWEAGERLLVKTRRVDEAGALVEELAGCAAVASVRFSLSPEAKSAQRAKLQSELVDEATKRLARIAADFGLKPSAAQVLKIRFAEAFEENLDRASFAGAKLLSANASAPSFDASSTTLRVSATIEANLTAR